jgi:hypothetical protein
MKYRMIFIALARGLYQSNIATGAVVQGFNAADASQLYGAAAFDEITAPIPGV